MIITHVQDDGTERRVDTDDLSALEAAAIEEATGEPWRQIEAQLQAQDPTAMRAVLWALRRRIEPDLDFATYDIPGWRRRLRARVTRAEIDEALTNVMRQALAKSEDSTIDMLAPHLRKLADDPDDVDDALDALGKGHLARHRKASED